MALAAKLKGVPYVDLVVNGTTYDVPIINPEFKQEIYLVKKALKGDVEARELLIGQKGLYTLAIGNGDVMRWLYMDEKTEWVEIP